MLAVSSVGSGRASIVRRFPRACALRVRVWMLCLLPMVSALHVFSAGVGVSLARDGDVDPSFGVNGKVFTDLGDYDMAHDVALQSDGKLVVAGSNGGHGFVVVRYNSDGSLDTSFGSGGKVVTSFNSEDNAYGLALQPDGKIVVVGRGSPTQDFVVVRYNNDGSLDTTFGTGGKVITDLGGDLDQANAVALQPDGKIVVVGRKASDYSGYDTAIVRYTANGSLDTSFGSNNDGKVIINVGGLEEALDVAIQADGRIVVVGTGGPGGNFVVLRLNANGTLDPSFGGSGTVLTDIGGNSDTADGVALQADNKIVVAGDKSSSGYGGDFAVVRYKPDGSLDSSFGTGGKVVTDLGGSNMPGSDAAYDVVLEPSGKILLAGRGGSSQDFALVRYNLDGSLDGTFGNGGVVLDDLGKEEQIEALALEKDGKIVGVGSRGDAVRSDFAVARYLSGAGGAAGSGSVGQVGWPGASGGAGAGSGAGSGDRVAPRVFSLTLSPRALRAARSGPPFVALTKRVGRGVGAKVTVRVSEPGMLVFSVYQRLDGRRVGRRCLPSKKAPRRSKRCVRLRQIGRDVSAAARGLRAVLRFTGRVPRSRGGGFSSLGRGKYRLVVRAVDAAGNRSSPRAADFVVRTGSR